MSSELKLPKDFLFGYSTASYQIEGSVASGGRLPSIWDTFAHTPGKITDGSNGDVTCDSYRLFREDIKLMKSYGANTYRFSVSWSRIIPKGGKGDEVNGEGILWYQNFIKELLKNEILPCLTLYHWDLPQALEDRYGGWLSRDIIPDFLRYTEVCYKAFGDVVKHWITFNEPWVITAMSYGHGLFAPGHVSNTEPYIAAHHLLLAHAYAVELYRTKYKSTEGGIIGITLDSLCYIPYDGSPENVKAAQDAYDHRLGWFADPIWNGYYPNSMKCHLVGRLPEFTTEEIKVVQGSSDFFGLNHYTTNLARPGGTDELKGFTNNTFTRPDGTELGKSGQHESLQTYGPGFRELLNYVWKTYKTPIYITENGFSVKDECQLPLDEAIHDQDRVDYLHDYTQALLEAIAIDGVDIRSYITWTLMDNFEWGAGFSSRFGVTHVDFETLERTPKASATFLKEWFEKHRQ